MFYFIDPTRISFHTIMVRTLLLEILSMRKENTNKAVPLDVVPERRTERCSPRFRPGDRFCDLSFRYLSPGSEGEKCRPLDHMRQIPFIHSSRFIVSSNIYIYRTVFLLFPPCGAFKCVLVRCIFDHCACTLDQGSEPLLKFCYKYVFVYLYFFT